MEYRLFGRTGMRVSVLGLGCGGFGGVGSAPELFGRGEDKPTAFALMNRAWDEGINYFDTADSYGGGVTLLAPMCRTLPACISSFIVCSVSSTGVSGSGSMVT